MAFNIKQSKRMSQADIQEIDDCNNELTLDLVQRAESSNVLATQSWVSKILKQFCCWTNIFHTNAVHATTEVATGKVQAKQAYLDEIHANSIILTNSDGGMVKIGVGQDGRLSVQETLSDVYVYPDDCLVREYLYRFADVPKNFTELTPCQTLLNFVPLVGWKRTEFNDQICQILCVADGQDEFVGRTLLFNIPADKVVKGIEILDSDGNTLK